MSKIQNRQIEEDEIDLIELFKKVYLEKKLIFKVTLFALFLELFTLYFNQTSLLLQLPLFLNLVQVLKLVGLHWVGLHLLLELI